jgi:hypothetical protein
MTADFSKLFTCTYETGAKIQTTAVYIVTAVKTSNHIWLLAASSKYSCIIDLRQVTSVINTTFCKIWGFHGGDHEEYCLLGCGASAATCSRCSSFADFSSLKMEAIRSSETSVHTRSTWRHNPEDGILQHNIFFKFYDGRILNLQKFIACLNKIKKRCTISGSRTILHYQEGKFCSNFE